jgi:hypothetical protein
MSPFWHIEFAMAPRVLENMYELVHNKISITVCMTYLQHSTLQYYVIFQLVFLPLCNVVV